MKPVILEQVKAPGALSKNSWGITEDLSNSNQDLIAKDPTSPIIIFTCNYLFDQAKNYHFGHFLFLIDRFGGALFFNG